MIRIVALFWIACLTGLRLQAQECELRFDIAGMPDGHCRIIGMLGGQNYLVDSIPAHQGSAVFRQASMLPGGLYYFVLPDQQRFAQLLIDAEQHFTLKANAQDLVGSAEFEGSLENTLLYQNLRFEQRFKHSLDSLDKLIQQNSASPNLAYLQGQKAALLAKRKAHIQHFQQAYPDNFFSLFKLAGQNPELIQAKKPDGQLDTLAQLVAYRQAYFEPSWLADERLLRTPVIPNKLKTFITQLCPQNADSIIRLSTPLIEASRPCAECYKYIVNWIAIQYEQPTFMGGEAILVHLVDNYFTEEVAATWFAGRPEELAKIRKKVKEMRPSLIGKTGQDLRCKNLEGQYESLYALKAPIKVLFMYSYSCSHCKERAPVMRDVLKQWQGKVEVFALCLDPEADKCRQFVESYQLQGFHNVIDPDLESKYYWKYHVDITPECYVLDANNKIVAKDLHPNQLEPIFKRILNQN